MADTEIERLIVQLEARFSSFEKDMKKAVGISDKSARQIAKNQTNLEKTMKRSAGRIGSSLLPTLGGIAAALSVREIIAYADSWTDAGNKIVASGTPVEAQARRLRELADLAVETRTAFEPTVATFSRLQRSTESLGLSEQKLLRLTETINKSFIVGGAAASEQASSILQLSQAIASGVLGGDELRSVREGAPLIARAIADVMGVAIGDLKKLGADGKITVDVILRALEKLAPKVDEAFGKTVLTVRQALSNLETRFTEFTGSALSESGGTAALAAGINVVAENLDKLVVAAFAVATALGPGLLLRAVAASTTGFGVLSAAILANPFGAFAIVIGAAATALVVYGQETSAASIAQEALSEAQQNARNKAAGLKTTTDGLAKSQHQLAIETEDATLALQRQAAQDLRQRLLRSRNERPGEFRGRPRGAGTGFQSQDTLLDAIRIADREVLATEARLSRLLNEPENKKTPPPASTTEDAIKKAKKDKQVIADLAREIATFGNIRQQAIDAALARLSELASPAQRAEVERLAAALQRLSDPALVASAALETENDQLARLIAAHAQGAEAVKALTNEIEIENAAREKGIDLGTDEGRVFEERLRRNQQLTERLDDLNKKAEDGFDVAKELGLTFNSAFENAIVDGGKLSDVLDGLVQDLIRLTLRAFVLQAALRAIGIGPDGLTGGGLAGFLGTALSGLFGGGGSSGGAGGLAPAFSHGGVSRRPAIFGEAGPEAAVPLPDGRRIPVDLRMPEVPRRGGGGPNIQIVNNTPAEVRTERSRGGNGGDLIRFVIDETKKEFGRGGFDAAQKARFGVTPRRVKR